MAIRQDVGKDPLYVSGDALLLQVSVEDQDGNAFDLSSLPLSAATWALANERGGTPFLTKTLGAGVTVVTPPGTDGRMNIQINGVDTASLKEKYWHEFQLEPGPLTVFFGDFVIQDDSITP